MRAATGGALAGSSMDVSVAGGGDGGVVEEVEKGAVEEEDEHEHDKAVGGSETEEPSEASNSPHLTPSPWPTPLPPGGSEGEGRVRMGVDVPATNDAEGDEPADEVCRLPPPPPRRRRPRPVLPTVTPRDALGDWAGSQQQPEAHGTGQLPWHRPLAPRAVETASFPAETLQRHASSGFPAVASQQRQRRPSRLPAAPIAGEHRQPWAALAGGGGRP